MNINDLEQGIKTHKIKSPKTYKEIINITVPFYVLYNRLISKVNKVQEQKFFINNSELDVLGSLKMSGDENYILSPTRLYERLLFSSGGMTKVLKKLEEKKYIKRLDNKEDKRSKLVQMTPLGDEIMTKSLKEVIEVEEECFKNLNDEEREIFKNLLLKVLKDS